MAEKVASKNLHRIIGTCAIYRHDVDAIRYLIMKRRPDIKIYPSLWTVAGGGMEREDYESEAQIKGTWESPLETAVLAEVQQEAGVEIGPLEYLSNFVFDRPDGVPVFGVRFAAEYKSGDVVLDPKEAVEYAWATAAEIPGYEFTGTAGDELQKLDALLKVR